MFYRKSWNFEKFQKEFAQFLQKLIRAREGSLGSLTSLISLVQVDRPALLSWNKPAKRSIFIDQHEKSVDVGLLKGRSMRHRSTVRRQHDRAEASQSEEKSSASTCFSLRAFENKNSDTQQNILHKSNQTCQKCLTFEMSKKSIFIIETLTDHPGTTLHLLVTAFFVYTLLGSFCFTSGSKYELCKMKKTYVSGSKIELFFSHRTVIHLPTYLC